MDRGNWRNGRGGWRDKSNANQPPQASSYASAASRGATSGRPSRGRDASRGRNDRQPERSDRTTPKRPCDFFLRYGRCNYGDGCKFSHALPTNNEGAQINLDESPRRLLLDLKTVIKTFSHANSFRSRDQFEKYLQLAIEILDSSDYETRSEVLTLLSRNELQEKGGVGYEIIREVCEKIGIPPPFYHALGVIRLDDHILPFIRIVVHEAFTQNCVEKSFRYIIHAVYGQDGERGSRFLKRVLYLIAESHATSEADTANHQLEEQCYLLSRLLYYLVQLNPDAMQQTDFANVHTELQQLCAVVRATRTSLSGKIDRYLSGAAAYLFPIAIQEAATPTQQLSHSS